MEIKCYKMIERSKYLNAYSMLLVSFVLMAKLFLEPNDTEKAFLTGVLLCNLGYLIINLVISIINFKKFKENAPVMIGNLQDVLKKIQDDMRDDK